MADPKMHGHLVEGVSQTGSSKDGQTVLIELLLHGGRPVSFLIPYQVAARVEANLRTARDMALQQRAKLPGYEPSDDDMPLGLKRFEMGLRREPNIPTEVALKLRTETGLNMSLMVSPQTTRRLAQELLHWADEAEKTAPLRPS